MSLSNLALRRQRRQRLGNAACILFCALPQFLGSFADVKVYCIYQSTHWGERSFFFLLPVSSFCSLSLSGALPARNDATLLARLAESRITFPYTKSRLVLAKKMKIKRGGYLHSRWNEAARYIGCCDRRRDVPPSISNVATAAIHKQPLGKSPNWISFRHTMEVWLQRGGRERYFLLSVFIISRRTELAIFWPRGSSTQTMEKLEIRVARH